MNLHEYPIIWYRQKSVGEMVHDVKKGVYDVSRGLGVKSTGSFVDGLVKGVDKLLGNAKKDVEQTSIPMTIEGVNATLSIIDSKEHGPVIKVQAIDTGDKNEGLQFKIIPLYKVSTISAGWSLVNDPTAGGVKLFGRSDSLLGGVTGGEELLRFDTLGGPGGVNVVNALFPVKSEPNKYSEDVMEQLRALVEWNRRRIAKDVESGRVNVIEGKDGVTTTRCNCQSKCGCNISGV